MSIANQVLQAPTGYTVKASATSLAPTVAGASGVVGTAADPTHAGTNSLNGKSFVFTPAVGAATTITVSSTVAAGNVNSIDDFNAALTSAGLGLTVLSIVQLRQDFNKNLINVLQTGSANLTLAASNAQAASSQALSTRQSIGGSALALSNPSQQSVLQLVR